MSYEQGLDRLGSVVQHIMGSDAVTKTINVFKVDVKNYYKVYS